jgi:hypothetical protein
MAKQTLNTIKNWFKTGLKPTQAQFWDTWDSFWHKDEMIPSAKITNLDTILTGKASQEGVDTALSEKASKQQLTDAVSEIYDDFTDTDDVAWTVDETIKANTKGFTGSFVDKFGRTINVVNGLVKEVIASTLEADLTVYINSDKADNCFGICDIDGNDLTDFTVDWGDGIIEIGTFYHDYSDIGNYTIKVYLTAISSPGELFLTGNIVTGVEMSKLTPLLKIYLNSVSFTSIDLTPYQSLEQISVENCQISALDLSNNLALTTVYIKNVPITELDLTSNESLQYVTLDGSEVSTLDLSHNLNLKTILVQNSPTTHLGLESYTQIQTISLDNLNITDLNLFNNLPAYMFYISVINCSNLSTIENFTAIPLGVADVAYYSFSGNALVESVVNQILSECDAKWQYLSGYHSGALKLEGGTNAAPSGVGTTAKIILNSKNRQTTTN